MDRLRTLPLLFGSLDFVIMLGLELAYAVPALLHLPATDWTLNILTDGRAWLLVPLPVCWLCMGLSAGLLRRHLQAFGLYLLGIALFFGLHSLSARVGEEVKILCPILYAAGTALALLHLGQGFPALRRYLSRSPS
jgi:hypothetical protein